MRQSKRALLVTCVFPPEPLTSASTSHSLAKELSKRGYDVTVITPYPSRPGGRVFSGFRRRLFERSRESGGIDVVRCFSTTSRKAFLVSRLFENLSFGLFGGLAMAMLRRPDVIYANTWPLFASGVAALVARFRRIPIVVSIQDVYPESLYSLGRLRNESMFARLLSFVDARIAHIASGVVVISRRVERIYLSERRIPAKRLHLIPNWRESEEPPDLETVRRRREGWGISQSTFLFLFAGNVAAACGIDGVIEAISTLPPELGAQLVIAGSGSALERCRIVAGRQGRERIVFCGSFLAQETLPILGAADVLILPTQGDQSLVSMPSKLISYMLAGRPVLAVARSESDLAEVVNESGCGWVVEPGDIGQLAGQMSVAAAMDRSDLMRIGMLSREYALAHFSAEACLPKVIGVLEEAMDGERRNFSRTETCQSRHNIREASTADLAKIVTLHQGSFPGFLMTMLGGGFLRVYYETALQCTGTIALIAEAGGRPAGFVVGYVDPQEFYGLLRRRRLRLVLAAARGLLFAPELLPRILGNMRRLRRSVSCSTPSEGGAELASIGVHPTGSGNGLGSALVTEFIRHARARARKYVYLTTDAVDNDKVNGFYGRLGFARSSTFLAPGGRLMNEYVLPLENRA